MAATSSATIDLDRTFETHRRELTGYCYRMLGAGSEAEDAVQETMLRAWRSSSSFEGRSSLRSWLYRIATNVCVDMHRSPQRRARPMDLGASTAVAGAKPGEPRAEHAFVQPVADAKVIDSDGDPASVAVARDSIRLAFVAALQHLPARQRAALILCDVLHLSAIEVAAALETSVASVNSALQRARATMTTARVSSLDAVTSTAHRQLVDRYVDAFQRYDVAALVQMMRDDVVLSMPPYDMWLQGPSELAAWFLGQGIGCKGGRLLPVAVNGTAGFGNYRIAGPGRWEPFALQVIEIVDDKIIGHHNFLYPERFAEFGLPPYVTD
jgi:RNA polymerase sigma-70 factor, ECF subfamily